jgi:AraC-like DNA-binding protein
MTAIDLPVFATASVRVGAFRCPRDYPSFGNTGPIENFIVVFPRTAVWIRHAGSRPFVADPQTVTIYNRGQEYTRAPISADGDRSDWYGVSSEVASAIARAVRGSSDFDPDHPFDAERTTADARLYASQRALFLRLRSGEIDALEAEEGILTLVARVIAAASRPATPQRASSRAAEAHRDLAARARAELARDVSSRTDVSALAQGLRASPYHLCRVFKAETGHTLHGYRLDLRFRMALERFERGHRDLSEIAHDLGFSSHSHMTALFRRRYGAVPSAVRQRLKGSVPS